MIIKLLTEHHLEFLSLKGGCTCQNVKLLEISCRGSNHIERRPLVPYKWKRTHPMDEDRKANLNLWSLIRICTVCECLLDLTLNKLGNLSYFCCHLLTFFKIYFFQKFYQEHYQRVKQFGSRSGLTLCQS